MRLSFFGSTGQGGRENDFSLLSAVKEPPLQTLDPQSPFRWIRFRTGSEAIHRPVPSPVSAYRLWGNPRHIIAEDGLGWIRFTRSPKPRVLASMMSPRIPFILRGLCLIIMHLSDPGTASCTKHLAHPRRLETVSRGRGLHCSMTVTIPGGEGRRSFLTGFPVFSRRPAREKIHLD